MQNYQSQFGQSWQYGLSDRRIIALVSYIFITFYEVTMRAWVFREMRKCERVFCATLCETVSK